MHDGWARAGLRCYGAAQVALALALVPGLATAFAAGANEHLGRSLLELAAGAAALGFLVLAGAHTVRAAADPASAPRWARSQLLAVAALALSAFILGEIQGGLLGFVAAGVGAWAVAAWTSHRPGGKRAGATAALIAGVAYVLALRNGMLAGLQEPTTVPADWAHAVVAPGLVAGGIAIACVLAVMLAEGTLRRTGVAFLGGTFIVAGLIAARRGFDILGASPWQAVPRALGFETAEVLLACVAIALSIGAAACAIAWGVKVLVREVPDLVRRLGHGVGEKEPGEVCVACGWIPVEGAKFCMMCGTRLWTPEHQPPASP